MRLLLAAILISVADPTEAAALLAPAPPALAPQARSCSQTTRIYAWRQGRPLKPQKLTELPNANAYSAVLRRIDGCEVPVIVRFGVGSGR
ncbi:MAG: hypothetical protein HOP96_03245 [Sphingomonas sp.]|nr:hypothetical protein [Sphingomonas sp.]